MGKRKDFQEGRSDSKVLDESSSAESSNDDDINMVDVEFEWFDPQPEHDFHGLKTLLRQLFDLDSQNLELSELADIILAQPLLGSTVKVDGNETDPYAFLTVINLQEHAAKPVIKNLIHYLVERSETNPGLSLLKDTIITSSTARVGLILTERLINIPSEVVPPMYKMLLEEISWALEEKEPYAFSHYLIVSKTYQEIESALDEETDRAHKIKKRRTSRVKGTNSSLFYFHPEDEILQRYAKFYGGFDYVNQQAEGQSDARRTFNELGIKSQGHMILIEADQFGSAVNAIEDYFSHS